MSLSKKSSKGIKNKKILFLNHRLDTLGGIETRWIDEFKYLSIQHYQVYLLIPEKRCNHDIAKLYELENLITINVGKIEIANEFIKLVNEIINVIRTKKIGVISIHMLDIFSCAAVMAAQVCRVPVISTVHGAADVYRIPIQRLLVQKLASKSFSLSISVSQLSKNIFQTSSSLSIVIPNLINLQKYQFQSTTTKPTWLIVSRLSPEKFPSILRFLRAADACQIPAVAIAGGGQSVKLKKLINKLNLKITVNFLGQIEDIAKIIPEYSGIAGMGRVAIEGLACQKPVCIISPEGNLIGLVTEKNFKTLRDYNFIGKTIAPIDNEKFFKQLEAHTFEESESIYTQLESELSVENWPEYIKQYEKIEFNDNQALEALYHKIAHFSVNLTTPFIRDNFFQELFYETLLEYDLEEIRRLWHFYEKNHGLNTRYSNPLKVRKSNKDKWWYVFK